MRIHGICLIKNESDILRYFFRESLRWCDRIYVFDNGSTDMTWDVVNEIAREHSQVIPALQDGCPFDDCLRGRVFRQFRGEAAAGDWWCRLDADELYIDDPRAFLARVPPHDHVVWSTHLQYYLTTADLGRFTREDELRAPEIDATKLPRYYTANAGEARFFRHRARLHWPERAAWPHHLGVVTPERIRLRHLQYRSPAQIQRRLDTRREAQAHGWQHFAHSLELTWQEKIANPADLTLDKFDGHFEIDPARLPHHLETPSRRALKRVMHGLRLWP